MTLTSGGESESGEGKRMGEGKKPLNWASLPALQLCGKFYRRCLVDLVVSCAMAAQPWKS